MTRTPIDTFSYNEDGSLNWINPNEAQQNEPLFTSEGLDVDAERYAPKTDIRDLSSRDKIDNLLNEFRNEGNLISSSVRGMYLRQIKDTSLINYFIQKVAKINMQFSNTKKKKRKISNNTPLLFVRH